MSTIFTIGHSTRSAEEFIGLLEGAGIQTLVDVRRYPGSRRYPHFNRENLSELLGMRGIAYVHEPALGGRRESEADSLVARGHDVRHILSDRRADPHEINQAAVIDARGQVTYPEPKEAQSSLFTGDR